MYIEKLSLGRTGGRLSLVSSPRLSSEGEARAYIPPGGRRPFARDPFAHGTPGERPMQVHLTHLNSFKLRKSQLNQMFFLFEQFLLWFCRVGFDMHSLNTF